MEEWRQSSRGVLGWRGLLVRDTRGVYGTMISAWVSLARGLSPIHWVSMLIWRQADLDST